MSIRKEVVLAACLAALVLCFAGCSKDPETAKKDFVASGKKYMEKGKFQEAAIQYRNALKLDPRYAEAYYRLGETNMAQQQWGDAFKNLQQAIDLDPANSDARMEIGKLYLGARQYKE